MACLRYPCAWLPRVADIEPAAGHGEATEGKKGEGEATAEHGAKAANGKELSKPLPLPKIMIAGPPFRPRPN